MVEAWLVENDVDVTVVKDFEALEEFIRISNHPILTADSVITASDGREININWLRHYLDKQMEGLPRDEQLKILARKKLREKMSGKMNGMKSRVFGTSYFAKEDGRVNNGSISVLDTKKDEIIELFGRMFSAAEVHEIIVSDFKIPITLSTVWLFRRNHAAIIEEKIEAFKREYSDVRLGIKRSRLEELSYIFRKTKTAYKEKFSRQDARLLMDILRQFKEEVEGDFDVRISGSLEARIENNINVHIKHEMSKNLNLMNIIVSKIATRTQVNPILLLKRLNDSYYKDFTAINGGEVPEDGVKPHLPSNEEYDFEKIKQLNDEKQAEMNKAIEEAEVLEEERAEEGREQEIKSNLLKQIKIKQAELNASKKRVRVKSIINNTREKRNTNPNKRGRPKKKEN